MNSPLGYFLAIAAIIAQLIPFLSQSDFWRAGLVYESKKISCEPDATKGKRCELDLAIRNDSGAPAEDLQLELPSRWDIRYAVILRAHEIKKVGKMTVINLFNLQPGASLSVNLSFYPDQDLYDWSHRTLDIHSRTHNAKFQPSVDEDDQTFWSEVVFPSLKMIGLLLTVGIGGQIIFFMLEPAERRNRRRVKTYLEQCRAAKATRRQIKNVNQGRQSWVDQ